MIPKATQARTPQLESALERLTRFHPKSMDLSLGRIERLLAALGYPQRRLPPVVHVAGTNGKGSTVAFMRAILEAGGHDVHAYISPHLVHFNERIRVAGRLLDDAELLDVIDEVEEVNADQPITFFEITTAIAFHLFARYPAAATLLETGLGGVMDATNLVDKPAATVITRISFDHMHLLGDTITAIAGEKAGIMKPGCPAIVSYQRDPAAMDVIERRAAEIGAPLFVFGREWHVEPASDGFAYRDRFGNLDLPLPGLLGAHQIQNAGAAIAALRHGGFGLQPDAFVGGMTGVEWPGRLQRLTRGPLAASLPETCELWLDGGHNDSGGEVLAEQARRWSDKPLHAVFGMLSTKDISAFLAPLAPHIAEMRTVAIPDESLSLTAEDVLVAALTAGIQARSAATIPEAVAELAGKGPCRILICGSLYLAGHVLAENG
jgi:dihydrofolate synthase/folylpolyglutamate synthase